ncbi:MYND-type domain-containing protein [Mycena kentingensis (nom. inval.)]|nr:MYND-type domain-containing protein [Mycena kentingensis (nom. inval.)]
MHDSLRLSNLQKLPFRLKALAERATRPGADMQAVTSAACRAPLEHQRLLVYVFYAALETTELDSRLRNELFLVENKAVVTTILGRVVFAFQVLGDTYKSIAREAIPEIWSRAWKWVQYLFDYEDCIDMMRAARGKPGVVLAWVSMARRFIEHTGFESGVVFHTPRLRVLITRSWSYLISLDGVDDTAFRIISGALVYVRGPMDEFIEGAGGRRAFAALIVRHLRREAPSPIAQRSAADIRRISGIFMLLPDALEALGDELRRAGVIPALVTACRALSVSPCPPGAPPETLHTLLRSLLFVALRGRRPERCIAQAIDAGLLPLITTTPRWEYTNTANVIYELVTDVLPPFLVFRSVVSRLTGAASAAWAGQMDHNARLDNYTGGAMNQLTALACARAEIYSQVHELKAESAISLLACSNIDCHSILDRRQLRRCGRCQMRVYCSSECQKYDWRSVHRGDCGRIAATTRNDALSSVKDQAYLTMALLTRDYHQQLPTLATDILQFLCKTDPGTAKFAIEWYYDYEDWKDDDPEEFALRAATPRVVSLDKYPAYSQFYDTSPGMQRAFAEGRVQLHLLDLSMPEAIEQDHDFYFPFEHRVFAFPLRAARGTLLTGLREIAMEMVQSGRSDVERFEGRVEALLAMGDLEAYSVPDGALDSAAAPEASVPEVPLFACPPAEPLPAGPHPDDCVGVDGEPAADELGAADVVQFALSPDLATM